jgi:hypothetical protein
MEQYAQILEGHAVGRVRVQRLFILLTGEVQLAFPVQLQHGTRVVSVCWNGVRDGRPRGSLVCVGKATCSAR